MAARDSLGGLQSKGALGCCCASALPRASQPATRMADSLLSQQSVVEPLLQQFVLPGPGQADAESDCVSAAFRAAFRLRSQLRFPGSSFPTGQVECSFLAVLSPSLHSLRESVEALLFLQHACFPPPDSLALCRHAACSERRGAGGARESVA